MTNERIAEIQEPYRVESDSDGCGQCGHMKTWVAVYTPEDIAESTSYDNQDDAEHEVEICNRAFQRGRESALDALAELIAERDSLRTQLAEAQRREQAMRAWQPIETAPVDGEMLVAWPGMKLDDDGNPTDQETGTYFICVTRRLAGAWDEPDALNAVGSSFDDDWEWAEMPTHWMPLPSPPILAAPEPQAEAPAQPSDAELLDACRRIWEDCLDRRGIKFEFRQVSDEVRDGEIFPAWVKCIRTAMVQQAGKEQGR